MANFDPERDPPYFAVLSRTPPVGIDAGQFLDAGERMIGLAAAEPGFLGIEELWHNGEHYVACYWDRVHALRRWRAELADHVPPSVDVDKIVCFEGCYWHWFEDVFDAVARVERDNVVVADFGKAVA